MFDFHEKRKIRSWLYSKPMIVLLAIPIAFLLLSVIERFQMERDTREKRIEQAAELQTIKERAAVLEARVEEAESERGIEAEIRNRYDVAKAGEQVVILIDDTETEQNQLLTEPADIPEEKPFWHIFKFW